MKTLLRWLCLAVLFLVTLELSARTEDWVRFRMPFLSPFRDQSDLLIRDRDGAHARPNSRYMKWVINEIGMRGPPANLSKPAERVRVITVGASETFGLYESADREYPRQLEDSLKARARRSGCQGSDATHIEVLNAGFPGMSLPTVIEDVRNRLRRLHPDVIVVYPTPTQYLSDDPPTATPPDSAGTSGALPTSRALHLRSLDRLREQAKLLIPARIQTWMRHRDTEGHVRKQPDGWIFEAPPLDRLALFERDLRRLVGAARRTGAQPVLVAHANAFTGSRRHDPSLLAMWRRFYPRATGETLVAFDSLARPVVERVAADSQVAFLDLPSIMHGSGQFQDISHFTDEGAGRFAGALAAVVAASAGPNFYCGPGARATGSSRAQKVTVQ